MNTSILEKIRRENSESTVCAIRKIMETIAENVNPDKAETGDYNSQRMILSNLFKSTSGDNYSKDSIVTRLLLLDSLYSTNATKTYYSIDNMADVISELGCEKDANNFFKDVASLRVEQSQIDDFFSKKQFGMHKDMSSGPTMTSLLSKYAYYCCLIDDSNILGFPIYDSLALYSVTFVINMLQDFSEDRLKNLNKKMGESFYTYVQELKKVSEALDLFQNPIGNLKPFDILDAYLWRMGKLSKGSLYLVVGAESYKGIINNLNLKKNDNEDNKSFNERLRNEELKLEGLIIKKFNDDKKNQCYPRILTNMFNYTSPIPIKKLNKNIVKDGQSVNDDKDIYSYKVEAIILYKMMTNEFSVECINDKDTKEYMKLLYGHWIEYFNR